MTEADRARWDERYEARPSGASPQLGTVFEPFADVLAQSETAIELACGLGGASVWLALQDVAIIGYDVSSVAIAQARALAERHGVGDRCRFEVADFDDGLPPGEPVDLVLCHMYRDNRLDASIADRVKPGGVLAIAALSEVGASPGRFRAKRGELMAAFQHLDPLGHGEEGGIAWLVASKP